MASGPAQTADDLSTSMKNLVDRMLEADVRRQITQRGQELAAMIGEATGAATERAAEAWKDSAPARRDAGKRMARAQRDAGKWSSRTWRRELRPAMKDMWKRRAVAITAAGAALPAGRELVEDAAARLGLRERRERRHWGAFFLGLLIGAAAGAALALLTAPKPGRQMRGELTERGREVAGDLASRARETDWVPLFQRSEADMPLQTAAEGGMPSETGELTAPEVTATAESGDRLEPTSAEVAETPAEAIDTATEAREADER
jgi:hypothetical protein